MSERWEKLEVVMPEQIFNEIRDKMDSPIGIMLFGVDCDFKDEIMKELIETLDLQTNSDDWDSDYEYAQCYVKTDNHLQYRFGEGRKLAMTILNSDNSSDGEIRRGFIRAIRNAGAKTVVGVYVKYVPIWLGDREITDTEPKNEQAWVLMNNPPTPEGLDYSLVVVKEKGEVIWKRQEFSGVGVREELARLR